MVTNLQDLNKSTGLENQNHKVLKIFVRLSRRETTEKNLSYW